MAVRNWDPFRELDDLRRQVERAFEEFTGDWRPRFTSAFLPGMSARSYPLINLNEDSDSYHVTALAPGLDAESLEISVLDNTLRIAGEKQAINKEIRPEAYHRNERGAGRFVRTITLPTPVKSDGVTAEYTDGLLKLTLPKVEEAKPKRIEVKVA